MGTGSGALLGCQLNGPFAPEDADFRPLAPPTIIENDETNPLPSRFVQAPPDENQPITFRTCIGWQSRDPLEARVWLDRRQPCTSFASCGIPLFGNVLTVPFSSETGICRVFEFRVALSSFGFPADRQCIPVDLYVSPEFKTGPGNAFAQANVPSRPGNVAHARWYIVRTADAGVPTVDQCCAGGTTPIGMCTY